MDDGAAHPGGTSHAFTRGGAGRGGGGGGGGGGQGGGNQGGDGSASGGRAPAGCLFGGWRSVVIDDQRAAERPPLQGVAALGLLLVVMCVLVFWFIAR
jgi:hypothetical protein